MLFRSRNVKLSLFRPRHSIKHTREFKTRCFFVVRVLRHATRGKRLLFRLETRKTKIIIARRPQRRESAGVFYFRTSNQPGGFGGILIGGGGRGRSAEKKPRSYATRVNRTTIMKRIYKTETAAVYPVQKYLNTITDMRHGVFFSCFVLFSQSNTTNACVCVYIYILLYWGTRGVRYDFPYP